MSRTTSILASALFLAGVLAGVQLSSFAKSVTIDSRTSTPPANTTIITSAQPLQSNSTIDVSGLDLTGQVAIVTGGTSGLGRATAILLAARGARVIVAGRRRVEGDATVAMIAAAATGSRTAHFVAFDAASAASCKQLIAAAVIVYGRIDLCFNNSGIYEGDCNAAELSNEKFEKVQAINVNGMFYCMKYQLLQIQQQQKEEAAAAAATATATTHRHYSIVNNSSCDGIVGSAGAVAYNASKHAVMGMTKAAALDYGKHRININAVCPGWIGGTAMTAAEPLQKMIAATPYYRIGVANDIAEAVAFLLSPAAAYVHGAGILVDGGLTCV